MIEIVKDQARNLWTNPNGAGSQLCDVSADFTRYLCAEPTKISVPKTKTTVAYLTRIAVPKSKKIELPKLPNIHVQNFPSIFMQELHKSSYLPKIEVRNMIWAWFLSKPSVTLNLAETSSCRN